MSNKVNRYLESLSKLRSVEKGEVGEDIIYEMLLLLQKKIPADIYHSFMYPYVSGIPGNIVKENGSFKEIPGSSTTHDEVDLIFITNYKIFLIEVKAYRANDIRFDEEWTYHLGKADHKSVLAQSEKHGRHFYHTFADYIPKGEHKYIVPLVVLVDKCTFEDRRSEKSINYLPACLRNELYQYIQQFNYPLEYRLDIPLLRKGMETFTLGYKKLMKGI